MCHNARTVRPVDIYSNEIDVKKLNLRDLARGVARNLIWVGINGSRRQNNHKKIKVD